MEQNTETARALVTPRKEAAPRRAAAAMPAPARSHAPRGILGHAQQRQAGAAAWRGRERRGQHHGQKDRLHQSLDARRSPPSRGQAPAQQHRAHWKPKRQQPAAERPRTHSPRMVARTAQASARATPPERHAGVTPRPQRHAKPNAGDAKMPHEPQPAPPRAPGRGHRRDAAVSLGGGAARTVRRIASPTH